MDRLEAGCEGGFLDGFRHGRVRVAGAAEVFRRTAELHQHRRLVDHLAGAEADDVHAEDPVGVLVGKNLDEATKKKVAAALAEIKGLPWGDRGELNGFAPTNDQAYDVVRNTAKALNLDLGKMK